MKKALVIISLLISTLPSFSQRDFGLFGGAFYYLGDINPSKQFYDINPGYGLLYRQNLDSRYALNLNARYATLSGNDADFDNEFQQIRNQNFNVNLIDIAFHLEFNFLPLTNDPKTKNFTPYIYSGAALVYLPETTGKGIMPALPFGLGFKLNLGSKFGIATEWGFRKTFSDDIDQLSETLYTNNSKLQTHPENTDLYSFATLSLFFRFSEDLGACPAYH